MRGRLDATRIGTRNATYILQNTVREGLCGGTTFKPRTKQEPKNASAPRRLRFIRTPHYNGQFALSLGKESPIKGVWYQSFFNQNMRIQPFLLAPRGKGRFLLAKELLYSFLEIVQC